MDYADNLHERDDTQCLLTHVLGNNLKVAAALMKCESKLCLLQIIF